MKAFVMFTGLLILILSACKSNRYDNGKKVGKWVEQTVVNGQNYKFIYHYKNNGRERGNWKYYRNDTLTSNERYRGNISHIKIYHDNGKISSCGKATTDISDPEQFHWFYIGEWKVYAQNGKMEYLRYYENGQQMKEVRVPER